MFRWLVFLIVFPLYSVFLNVFGSLFYKKSPWFRRTYQAMLRIWSLLILWPIRIKIEISNSDRKRLLSPNRSQMIVANHKSHLDSLILWAIVPKENFLCFAAKKELFKLPICGKILTFNESIKIDRANPQGAYDNLSTGFDLSDIPKTLVIYAEGTRNTKTSILLPFKRGPFLVAKQANIPILPVIIHGTQYSMPSGKFLPKQAIVTVKVLDLINPEYFPNDITVFQNTVWKRMKTECELLQDAFQ